MTGQTRWVPTPRIEVIGSSYGYWALCIDCGRSSPGTYDRADHPALLGWINGGHVCISEEVR